MALIEVRNATVRYEGVPAIENVDLSIQKGEYLVVLGENGSGKSTLVRAMVGLVKLKSGSVVFSDGLKKNRIGYLPQQTEHQKDFPASVEEVVLSGCVSRMGMRPWFSGADKLCANNAMELLEITHLRKKPYRALSGGQQQRALLARALCATDQLLILDEPVSGLDPEAAEEMYAVIANLNKKKGVAIVMVSHDINVALNDATRVLVMEKSPVFLGDIEGYKQFVQGRRLNV